jgi:hypothetical protein
MRYEGMRFALLCLVACQSGAPTSVAPPVGSPARASSPDAAIANPDAAIANPDAAVALGSAAQPKIECMSDERQWGTTCCRTEGAPGRRRWLSCRGPQLGKVCHRRGDCDIACSCDRSLAHHEGMTGVTGHCSGDKPSGVWLCELDDDGKVSSLIID